MVQVADMAASRQLGMRMTPEEMARLETLSKHYGVGMTDVVRLLVKRDLDTIAKNVVEKERDQKRKGYLATQRAGEKEEEVRSWVKGTRLGKKLTVEFDRVSTTYSGGDPLVVIQTGLTFPDGTKAWFEDEQELWDALVAIPGSKLKAPKVYLPQQNKRPRGVLSTRGLGQPRTTEVNMSQDNQQSPASQASSEEKRAPSFVGEFRQALRDREAGKRTLGAMLCRSRSASQYPADQPLSLAGFVAEATSDLHHDIEMFSRVAIGDSDPSDDTLKIQNAFFHARTRLLVLGEIASSLLADLEAEAAK